jgi:hypothetical protein
MKFYLVIGTIISSAALFFVLIYFITQEKPQSTRLITSHKNMHVNINNNIKNNAIATLSSHDAQIYALAALSDEALKEEFSILRTRLYEEELFAKLERKLLNNEQKIAAKALIERFTLLSLESTRRRYMNIEPELQEPLYAHRDSFKDIAKIINKY